MRRLVISGLIASLFAFGVAAPSQATPSLEVIAVTTTQDLASPTCPSVTDCSLRGAIGQASSISDHAIEVDVPEGTYALTRGTINLNNYTSHLDISIKGVGPATLIEQGQTSTNSCDTSDDGQRAFDIYVGNSAGHVNLNDLRISGFHIYDQSTSDPGIGNFGGAAIQATGGGSLNLNRVRLDHNSVHGCAFSGGRTGGGALRSTARVSVNNSKLDNNTVSTLASRAKGVTGGAAIYTDHALEIVDSSVTQNSSDVGASKGMAGGAIEILSENLSVIRSEISHNVLTVGMPDSLNDLSAIGNNGGAAIYQDGQDINIVDSTIDSNLFTLNAGDGLLGNNLLGANGGGAIYQYGNATNILNSTLSNNIARLPSATRALDPDYQIATNLNRSGGGAIFDNGDSALYTNSTFTGNLLEASDDLSSFNDPENGGGAVFFDGERSRISVQNSTIALNEADGSHGGAFMVHETGNGQTDVHLGNSIIGGNVSTIGGDNCWIQQYGDPENASYFGVITSDGYNLTTDSSCGLSSNGDRVVTDLGLNALADNGGHSKTMSLKSTSPARNAGNVAGCVTAMGDLLFADQRGQLRPQGGRCDIGAVEYLDGSSAAGPCLAGKLGNILFSPNSASLDSQAKKQLRGYAHVIASTSCTHIVLKGFTAKIDSPNASTSWRVKLAKKRNSAVNKYLTKQLTKLNVHVSVSKIAYGSLHPVQSNDLETGRVVNRRVEIDLRAS